MSFSSPSKTGLMFDNKPASLKLHSSQLSDNSMHEEREQTMLLVGQKTYYVIIQEHQCESPSISCKLN